METFSDFKKNLPGKIFTPRQATLDISLKFDLWKDYQEWLDPGLRQDFWHDIEVLETASVSLEITLGEEIIINRLLKTFEDIKLHHEFDDEQEESVDLRFRLLNMGKLPIRDNTGSFVCGMLEISSVELNGIEITHLLENTMFGVDTDMVIPLKKPVYQWMVENVKSILPKTFDNLLDDENQ